MARIFAMAGLEIRAIVTHGRAARGRLGTAIGLAPLARRRGPFTGSPGISPHGGLPFGP